MVIANKYANAFTEVYEILQYLDKDEYKKISLDLIETIQNNRNTNYKRLYVELLKPKAQYCGLEE